VADIAILSEAADDIFIESSKMFIEQFWIWNSQHDPNWLEKLGPADPPSSQKVFFE
jgi:hypothetical protein